MTPFLQAAAELAPSFESQTETINNVTYRIDLRLASILRQVNDLSVEKRNWQAIRKDLLEIAALCDSAATRLGLQNAADAIGKEIPF